LVKHDGECLVSRCIFCICPACSMEHCWQHTHFNRCTKCLQNYSVPTTSCDFFKPVYVRHVYRKIRVRRKARPKLDIVIDKLDEVLKKLKE
jgi:hypothetical protein